MSLREREKESENKRYKITHSKQSAQPQQQDAIVRSMLDSQVLISARTHTRFTPVSKVIRLYSPSFSPASLYISLSLANNRSDRDLSYPACTLNKRVGDIVEPQLLRAATHTIIITISYLPLCHLFVLFHHNNFFPNGEEARPDTPRK